MGLETTALGVGDVHLASSRYAHRADDTHDADAPGPVGEEGVIAQDVQDLVARIVLCIAS
jgi:hypothetical protein